MNAKIVTLLERHVEKIVLAVAVAGAGFIAYSGITPTTIPDPTNPSGTLSATGVEDKVGEAVQKLEDAKDRTSKISEAELTSSLKDYVAEYNNLMLRHPLSEAMVASSAIPRFAPIQASISNDGGGGGAIGHLQLVAPNVLPPRNVTAVADRGSVTPPPTDPTAAAAAAASGAPPVPTIDKNWVCVSGNIPWKEYIDAYNSVRADQKLPADAQHNVLYRIDVQRRTRTGNTWSPWQEVAPSQAGGPPIPDIDWNSLNDTDWITTVSQLDANFQRIAEPIFYYLAPKDPTLPPQPVIPPIIKASATTAPAPTAAPAASPPVAAAGRPPIPGRGTIPPGYHPDGEGNLIPNQPAVLANPNGDNPAAAPGSVPGMTVDINTLKQQGDVPFWFWDETVDAGHDYQYRTCIVMYNPLYRYPNVQDLKNKDDATKSTLASSWVTVPGTVSVGSDLAFFVNSNNLAKGPNASQKVSFLVFKWTNGGWYQGEWTREPGESINGRITIIDKLGANIDVTTGYTLVDVQTAPGGDLIAVLLSPSGELITRSATGDSRNNNADRRDKEDKRFKITPKPKALVTPTAPVIPPRPPGQRGNNPDNQ